MSMDVNQQKLIFWVLVGKEERTKDKFNKYNDGYHAYRAIETVLKALGESTGTGAPKIGVLWFCNTNKGDGFIKDALELCMADGTGVDGLLIVTADDIGEDEVPFRKSPILCAHKERIQICKANLMDIHSAAGRLKKAFVPDGERDLVFRQKLVQVAATYAVFQPIGVAAGHGARNDVANRILAPIRLLARTKAEGAVKGIRKLWKDGDTPTSGGKSCWQNFAESLEEKNGFTYTLVAELRREMVVGQTAFETAVKDENIKNLDSVEASADALMTLMTEYRRNAGIVTEVESDKERQRRTSRDNKLPETDKTQRLPEGEYRLLVVDDHWAEWQPVLDVIKGQIEAANLGTKITVLYSPNGVMAWEKAREENREYLQANEDGNSKVKPPTIPIVSAAFRADAVLLDIMLGDESGLDVLKKIREYSESIPVILWTTTRSQEITNQAQQANGVILKKTCEAEAFAETLTYWLKVGHNRHGVSLLNPFFDSVIRKPAYREYARDVSEWALKWMSGFHTAPAFRFFTDHGGRHFTKVLGYVERAIRPLLATECLAASQDEREQDFLALYLAVFLHELGMFPITSDGAKISTDIDYVKLVRALHAPRGMLLLEGNNDNWMWVDQDGLAKVAGKGTLLLGEEVDVSTQKDIHEIRAKCAALVGYHARCLTFVDEESGADKFLRKGGINKKRKANIDTATKAEMFRRKDGESAEDTATLISSCLKRISDVINTKARERLKAFAAILRVCDAIDKDESRNPPVYLYEGSPFIREMAGQNIETLKQMVCEEVVINDTDCSIDIALNVPAPAISEANAALDAWFGLQECRYRGLSGKRDLDGKHDTTPSQKEKDEVAELEKLLSASFAIKDAYFTSEDFVSDPGNDKGLWRTVNCTRMKNGKTRLGIWNECLEWWLDAAWSLECGKAGDGIKIAKAIFKKKCWIKEDSGEWDAKMIGLVCSMTGLFCGTEVFDEYRAISEVGMDISKAPKLGTVSWATKKTSPVTYAKVGGYLTKASRLKGGKI